MLSPFCRDRCHLECLRQRDNQLEDDWFSLIRAAGAADSGDYFAARHEVSEEGLHYGRLIGFWRLHFLDKELKSVFCRFVKR